MLSDKRGQSLLEVIIALAIFALISAAMITLSLGGFTALEQGGEQTEAKALAQEGIEAVRAIRDSAWNKLTYTTSSVFASSTEWVFDDEGTVEIIGEYTRTISFSDVCRDESDDMIACPGVYTDIHSKKVSSVVTWEVRPGVSNSVKQISYLTNWDTKLWTQADWFGGSGQSIWSDIIRYDSAEGVVDINSGQVSLDQTTDTSASTFWPFDIPEDYTYEATSIEVGDDTAQLIGSAVSSGETIDDGFENTIESSFDWSFTTSSDYEYAVTSIEVVSGAAQLISSGGSDVSYPTSKPNIHPSPSYFAPGIQSWDSFTETATKNGGEIYYQLSDDDGATWQYWTGLAWAVAGVSDYNIASAVNTSISSFSTSTEQIKFKAFLESDGAQQVQLDNINIGLSPPTIVWSFNSWGVGGGEVTPTGVKQITGGNPNNYVDISVPAGNNDDVGGYWEQAFITAEDNPVVSIDFDYSVIDFNGIPDLAEIRVYLDTATGDPVNQVGSSIAVLADGDWISATTIDATSAVGVSGTYYLKIAYWVETPASTIGPFTIGFDSVNLIWNAASYPIDKPTISNTNSFTPSALASWTSFTEIATKNGGEIYYQLSNDDGATWQYWTGSSWATAGDSNYNTASVVNSAISHFDTTAKKFMFKAFLVSDGMQLIKLDNIDLQYNVTNVSYSGNQFIVATTDGAGLMSKITDTMSLRFTAKDSETVDAVRVYLEQEKGTSPTYRYGLQVDLSGQPSGIWLGATNQGYHDYQATATGWQTITLDEGVSLTQDTIYHIVIEYESGTVNSANAIELRRSNPGNYLRAFDSSADVYGNILFSADSGSSWVVQDYQPIFILDFSDATYDGNPYHNLSEHEIYGDNSFGQEFTPSSDIVISTMGMYVSENNEGSEGDVFVSLYNVSSGTLLTTSTLAVAVDLTINVYSWETATFDQPITLSAGDTYRLFVSAPGASATAHYLIRSASHNSDSVLNSVNYNGVNSFFVSSIDNGLSWSSNLNEDLSGFRFQQTIFNTLGYIISSAYNAGSLSAFNVVEWNKVTPSCSPNCDVKLQIQTAPDSAGSPGVWSSNWSGPDGEDGDETDYFIISTGELIHADHNGDQWIRYKATLVGDSISTPTLEEVIIYYQ